MLRLRSLSRNLLLVLMSVLVATSTLPAGATVGEVEADPVTWEQRKQLLLYGTVTNDRGVEYDVLAVPGYFNAALDVGNGARGMTSAVGEYTDPKLYGSIGSDLEHGTEGVKAGLVDHAAKETVEECDEDFHHTGEMRRRGVVGMWANYFWAVANLPMATGECAFETTGNIAAGTTKAAVSGAAGYVVSPAVRLGGPAAKAGYRMAWRGTAMPVGKFAWQNTFGNAAVLIGGNEPTRHNADGFWVSREGPTVWEIIGLQ